MSDPTILTPEEIELKRATTAVQLKLAEQLNDPALVAKCAARWVIGLLDLASPMLELLPVEPRGYLRLAKKALGVFVEE